MKYGGLLNSFLVLVFTWLFSDTGALFTCGDGTFGQLGHGDYRLHCYPVEVSFFASKHVEQIACGMRHSLVLLRGNCKDDLVCFWQTQCFNVEMPFYLDVSSVACLYYKIRHFL